MFAGDPSLIGEYCIRWGRSPGESWGSKQAPLASEPVQREWMGGLPNRSAADRARLDFPSRPFLAQAGGLIDHRCSEPGLTWTQGQILDFSLPVP
jgi:hypothetical protein